MRFNHIKNNSKERTSGNLNETRFQKSWGRFFSCLNLTESNFSALVNQNSRTWSIGDLSARLDRINYRFQNDPTQLTYDKILNFVQSDHNMVVPSIIIDNILRSVTKNSYWKLNDTILDDSYVDYKIKKICRNIIIIIIKKYCTLY
jgi:hypothetical protein